MLFRIHLFIYLSRIIAGNIRLVFYESNCNVIFIIPAISTKTGVVLTKNTHDPLLHFSPISFVLSINGNRCRKNFNDCSVAYFTLFFYTFFSPRALVHLDGVTVQRLIIPLHEYSTLLSTRYFE